MDTSFWRNCSSCGVHVQNPVLWYMDLLYCTRRCMHAAGCRWDCSVLGDCGCTPYAKRRRVLRSTRNTMRVMRNVLEDHGLMDELEDALGETGLTDVELDDPQDGPGEADEGSDVEDETVVLRAIVAARSEAEATVAARSEADVLHQLVNSAASLAERDRLYAENARLLAEADVRRQIADTAAEDARL